MIRFVLLLLTSFLALAPLAAHACDDEHGTKPCLHEKDAVTRARACLQEQNVKALTAPPTGTVFHKDEDRADFRNPPKHISAHGGFWVVEWQKRNGGGTRVYVHSDNICEIQFDE